MSVVTKSIMPWAPPFNGESRDFERLELSTLRPHVGSARSIDEFIRAYELVHRQYVATGLRAEHPSGMHLLPHYMTEHSNLYVASAHHVVAHTATLVVDSERYGLPLDAAFKDHPEVKRLRGAVRVAEATALASAPDHEVSFVSVLFADTVRRRQELAYLTEQMPARGNIFAQNH